MSSDMTIPTDLCLDGPLWQFAGRYWSQPDAQTAALALQEKGWSVTDVLCALWLALKAEKFSGFNDEQVVVWRNQVTETLRKVRKAVGKGNPATDQARSCIARSELEAERVELALAYRSLARETVTMTAPQQSTVNADTAKESTVKTSPTKTLALENLQAAAPEKAMDIETGRLLETLIDELQSFTERDFSEKNSAAGARQPC